MIEGLSISAFIMALVSAFVLFLKGIRKCNCTKNGLEIERDINIDIEQQQQYTLNLIRALKKYSPRNDTNLNIEKQLHTEERKILLEESISEIVNRLEKEIELNIENKKNQENSKKHKKQKSIQLIKNFIGLSNKNIDKDLESTDNNSIEMQSIKSNIKSNIKNDIDVDTKVNVNIDKENIKNNIASESESDIPTITEFIIKKNK